MPATPAALAVRADLAPAANLLADTSLADDFPIDVLAADLDDATLLARTLHWYQQHFAQQGAAAEALRRRGLLAEDLVETFEIGYAARELARQLPSATSAAGRRPPTAGALADAGIVPRQWPRTLCGLLDVSLTRHGGRDPAGLRPQSRTATHGAFGTAQLFAGPRLGHLSRPL